MMNRISTLIAGFSYSDRIAPILDGSATDSSLSLVFRLGPATQIFQRALTDHEFDLTEMSFAAHCIARSHGDDRFVGLPIFTSRMMRHHSIYVWGDHLHQPGQLAGARIGLHDYSSTTAVWLRGILAEHHGLDLSNITWCVGSIDDTSHNKSGGTSPFSQSLPEGIRQMPPIEGTSLTDMLARGALDAIISPGVPASSTVQPSQLRPLFQDTQTVEKTYLKTSGIFPIMHLAVLRQSRYRQNPSLATRIYQLFEKARHIAQERLKATDTLPAMVPWLNYARDPAFDALPGQGWANGINPNRHSLETFIRYLKDQRLLAAPITMKDIFAEHF